MFKPYLRVEAESDPADGFQWYEARRVGLGSKFLASVKPALSLIERNPEMYPVAVDDIRKAPIKRFPYIAYFVVLEDSISVLAVMHGRRHPPGRQERR